MEQKIRQASRLSEKWKKIPGYQDLYSASNYGRIRSKDRIVPCRGGKTRLHRGKVLAAGARGLYGYLTIVLHKDGIGKTELVHRLVAQAWIPNPKRLPFVLHLDDCPSNCAVDNLKWGTHQDNMDDMSLKERGSRGETKGSAKLTDAKVRKIRKLYSKGHSQRALAEEFGVAQSAVSSVVNNKTWTHV